MTPELILATTRPLPIDATVRDLLSGSTPADTLQPTDVAQCLLETAAMTLGHLQLIAELRRGHAGPIVIGIVEQAESFGIGSSGAIGVSGVLVDLLQSGDVGGLADVLVTAAEQFEAEDLIGGAAALLVAATMMVTDLVAQPSTLVDHELHDSLERTLQSDRDRRHCRIRRASRAEIA